jgi:hypothetical protein
MMEAKNFEVVEHLAMVVLFIYNFTNVWIKYDGKSYDTNN